MSDSNTRPMFTPGPWELQAGRSFKTASGSFHLAYGNHPKSGRPEFGNFVELDANARLISAAPEMYAALRLIDELGTNALDYSLPRNSATLSAIVSAARAALAKAEGRS